MWALEFELQSSYGNLDFSEIPSVGKHEKVFFASKYAFLKFSVSNLCLVF